MSRAYRKLRVFVLADDLAVQIYQASKDFPLSERFGLQSQIRGPLFRSQVTLLKDLQDDRWLSISVL